MLDSFFFFLTILYPDWQLIQLSCKNKLPHNAVHPQGIEPACAGGCLTANRKSPLEGGWFLKGATSGSLGKFVGSAQRKT